MKTTYFKIVGFGSWTYYVEYVMNNDIPEITLAFQDDDGPPCLDITMERLTERLQKELAEEFHEE